MSTLARRPYGWSFGISLAALCAIIGFQIIQGKVAYEFFSYDVFVVLDGILHLQFGHRPHVDFSSPVGVFYLLPYYLTTLVVPAKGMTIIYGNALFGLSAFALAMAVSWRRLSPLWAGLFCFYVGLVAITPRMFLSDILDYFLNYINQAFYNRFAWSYFCILCLLVALPRQADARNLGRSADAAISALLLFVLFYLKATYFLAGSGLLALSLVTVKRDGALRTAVIASATFASLMIAMELTTGITLPYFADLAHIAAAQPNSLLRLAQLRLLLDVTYKGDLGILFIAGLAAAAGGALAAGRAEILSIGLKTIFLIALMGAGLVVATYNLLGFEIPTTPVIALVAVSLFSATSAGARQGPLSRLLLPGIVVLIFLRPIVLDLGSIWRAYADSSASGNDMAWLQDTGLPDIKISARPNTLRTGENKGPVCCERNDNEYFYVVSDGVSLLRRHLSRPATVLSFTWSNPFPSLLGLPPAKNTLLWWDDHRTFSAASHPSGQKLFAELDYVMIPKVDVRWSASRLMREVYAEELQSKFVQLDETPYWILLAKR